VGSRAFGGWDRIDARWAAALERSVARHRHIPFQVLGGRGPARYEERLERYHRLLERTYAAIHQSSGASVVVDSTKDPAHAFVLRGMSGIDVRMVHLVRDSRGVAWSWAKLVRSPDVVDRDQFMRRFSPPVAGVRWVAYNAMVESLGWFGIPRLLLRYEDLVSDPRAALRTVASFADRPIEGRALAFLRDGRARLGVDHTVVGNPMRMTDGPMDIRADEAWRGSMPKAQRVSVTAITWPLLRRYSYPTFGELEGGGNPTVDSDARDAG
jgi:hypothetical protein